ncbi:hypothetical protein Ga0609869_001003 [Rhodovulum iodosum]|uniref:Uncharacterized protein n=1 Tax=Rhodovulum iodosum TaxID=68291 RepID=A0ABV3XQP5_9RHOB|nr:class I SAM-dependent methyltransferase [Rhodovulum robiginosum]RSK32921.1 hypothetical protein EJA01_11410 [Rhodovulum robiginosum]
MGATNYAVLGGLQLHRPPKGDAIPMPSSISPATDLQGTLPVADMIQPLSSRSLFWKARHLQQDDAVLHIPFLFWLVETCRPAILVDLGLGSSVSYFAYCQASERTACSTQCFGLHTGEKDGAGIPDAVRVQSEEYYEDVSSLVDGPAAADPARFRDGSVDLMHIDLNAGDAPISEVDHWLGKLSERAVIVLHGTKDVTDNAMRRALVQSLCTDRQSMRFDHGKGLTAILYGPKQQERLKRLAELDLGDPGHSEVRQVFTRLGRAHAFEQRVRDADEVEQGLLKQLRDAETRLDEIKSENEQTRTALEEAKSAYEERTRVIGELQARLFDKEQERAAENFVEAKKQIEALEKDRKTANAERDEAKKETQRWKEAAKAAEARAATANTKLSQETQAREKLEQAHAALSDRLSEAETTIAHQKQENEADAASRQRALDDIKAQLDKARADVSEAQELRFFETAALTRMAEDSHQKLEAIRADLTARQTVRDALNGAEIERFRAGLSDRALRQAYARSGMPDLKTQIKALHDAAEFDGTWYQTTYPDVSASEHDPAEHYLRFGAREGRNPGPAFDTMSYYLANPDVARAGWNALVHFQLFGRDEGRALTPSVSSRNTP